MRSKLPVAMLAAVMLVAVLVVILPPTGSAELTPSGPISIDGDPNLVNQASAKGWPGDGSASNPYIIANLSINSPGDAIRFMKISLHVVVENSTLAYSNRGFGIQDSSNITISNNTMVGGYYGIIVECSSGSTVSNITIYNNTVTCGGNGILVTSSSGSTVSNITISNNTIVGGYTGILLSSSDGYILSDTTLSHISISDNTINNGGTGIHLSFSSGLTVSNSTISDNAVTGGSTGIYVSSSNNTMVLNNIVTGAIYDGIIMPSSSNSTVSNNSIICGGNGIIMPSSSSNSTVSNNTVTCGSNGIIVSSSSGSTVSDNTITGATNIGILLDNSGNSTASNNFINGSLNIGIVLSVSDGSTISYNTVIGATNYGLILSSSSNSTIAHNTITGAGENGIRSSGAIDNVIMGNRIADATSYGIYLNNGQLNMIFGNILVDNNGTTSTYDPDNVQAYDGGDNQWNNETVGNHWSDWQGPDSEPNGIVDQPYAIDGGSKFDLLPVTISMAIVSPTSPYHTNVPTAALSGTACDGFDMTSVTWFNEATGASGAGTGTSSWSANVGLIEGGNNITVTVTDAMGGTKSENITVIYDTVAPTVNILSPAQNSYNNTGIETITWTSDDNYGLIVLTEISLDGTTWTTVTGTSYTTPLLSDGPCTVEVRVTDAAGNVNSALVSFTVSYGPTIIISPGSPIYTNQNEVDVLIEAPDYAPLTTGNCTRYVNGVLQGSSTIDDLIAGQTQFSELVPFRLDLGTNLFVITVNDTAGNSMTFSITVVYDTTAPIIDIVSPSDHSYNNTGSVTIVWDGDDELSGIAYYNVSLFNGATWDNTTYIDPSENSKDLTLSDGAYTVYVEAVDKAGNVNVTSVNFVVDTIVPTLTIITPSNNSYANTTSVTVQWAAGDPGSDVVKTAIMVDSGSWTPVSGTSYALTALTDGPHTIMIEVTDNAGNVNTALVHLIIDTGVPSVSIVSPANSSYNNTGEVLVSWTGNDNAGGAGLASFAWQLDSGPWTTLSATTFSQLFSELADATHSVLIRASDQASNHGDASVTFVVDTVAPYVHIDSPVHNSYNNTGSVTVNWSVGDVTSGIAKTEISTDGTTWTTVSGTSDVLTLADGSYAVYVRVTDNAGNVNQTSANFVVDTIAPTIVIDAPVDGSYNTTGTMLVVWTGSDELSGLSYFNLSAFDGYDRDYYLFIDAHEISKLLSGLDDGNYTVYVEAVDNAGNVNETSVTFIVDTTEPSVEIVSPTNGSSLNSSSMTVSWTADDASGIAHFLVRVDGGSWQSISAETLSAVIDDLEDGEHSVEVRVVDLADNAAMTSVTFIVDTTAPTVVVSPIGTGVAIDAKIVIEFSEPMNLSSIEIIVSHDVEGDVVFVDNVATYTPNALEYNTDYTVSVIGKDLAGNAVAKTWTFSTMVGVGNIGGRIVDSDGNALVNVTVTLSNGMTATTDVNGNFAFDNVTAGTYDLTVSKDGYQTMTKSVSATADATNDLGSMSMQPTAPAASSSNDGLLIGAVIVVIAALLAGLFLFFRRKKKA